MSIFSARITLVDRASSNEYLMTETLLPPSFFLTARAVLNIYGVR